MSIEKHLNQIIPEIIAKFPSIAVMYLFGSHSSGTAKADSDVDIAVFTDGRETHTITFFAPEEIFSDEICPRLSSARSSWAA